jgi:polar amino acid transport system ATP-binding protein
MISLFYGSNMPSDINGCKREPSALVTLRDLHVSFDRYDVLRGVNLTLGRNQAMSIIGPSGSGKSTILRCIAGLIAPRPGEVLFNGVDVSALSTDERRSMWQKHVGLVSGRCRLPAHRTALQNLIGAALRAPGTSCCEAKDIAGELLAKVRLADKAHSHPCELSDGQQQRIEIAHILAMRPALVLFDEVTSALERRMASEVLDVIGELVDEGLPCVLVTHEIQFAEDISNSVAYIEDGVIVEEATPDQILHSPRDERTRRFLNNANTCVRFT